MSETQPASKTNYAEYLKLSSLLTLQEPLSFRTAQPAHEEMLFIVTHQAYELWFKQIIFELKTIIATLGGAFVPETAMGRAVQRLERVISIQKLLSEHIPVLETMLAMDFLDFRHLIYPASGFQSEQFRHMENLLGLPSTQRLSFNSQSYHQQFSPAESERLKASEEEDNLLGVVIRWLERMPFLEKFQDQYQYDFWAEFESRLEISLKTDLDEVERNPWLNTAEKAKARATLEAQFRSYQALIHPDQFADAAAHNQLRVSFAAARSCIFIQSYSDEPALHQASRLLGTLITIDEELTHWRYRHALMAKRMLGQRLGTGGSSGHDYLKASTEQHRIFNDFFILNGLLLPRRLRPELPDHLKNHLRFPEPE